jgi:hypothetical protein
MIGKHVPRPKHSSSFKGLNDYITGKTNRQPGEKIAFTGCLNLASVETATVEMESLALENNRCADPVMHLLLSWRENEAPTSEQALEAVRITLGELNLSQCQAVYSLHQNTDNLHLHICVNRIDPETMKAIDPAHGWTRRAMEHAARRIEHAQCWQTEANTWSEADSEGKIIQKPITSDIRIRQETKDAENLTGEQSAIRKAQTELKDTMKHITSWNDLHRAMRFHGMEYKKKGSGAVIRVGEIFIKASSVSKNLSLGKLEKKFGVYRELQGNGIEGAADATKISQPKPLDKSNDNSDWKTYIAARKEYYRNKKQNRQSQSMSQRQEQRTMQDQQGKERKALPDRSKAKGSAVPR